MERAYIEPEAPAGAGIERMSLAGTCPGHRIERGPRRGNIPAFCWMTCGAFTELEGTLEPQAARLPPAMEWVCVNWRGHASNVPDLRPAQVSPESQSVDGVSTRAGDRIRVVEGPGGFFVSVDGDSAAGPLKSHDAALEYGRKVAGIA